MKKIRVFCDPMVVVMATIVIMVIPVYTLLLVYVYSHNLYEDKTEGIKVLLFAIFVGIVNIGVDLWCIPQWYSFVELDCEGLRLNTIYRKKEKIPYKKLVYFQIASYRHLYQERFFLLIGTSSVPMEKLSKINQVKSSESLVKIKLSPRACKKLMRVLPDDKKEKLEHALKTGLSNAAFNSDTYMKTQRRKERLKRRKNNKKNKKR